MSIDYGTAFEVGEIEPGEPAPAEDGPTFREIPPRRLSVAPGRAQDWDPDSWKWSERWDLDALAALVPGRMKLAAGLGISSLVLAVGAVAYFHRKDWLRVVVTVGLSAGCGALAVALLMYGQEERG